jgi:hypothetical protein
MEQKYLKLWGLYEKDYESSFKDLELSPTIIDFLLEYINSFPGTGGIVFQGNPKLATKTMGRTVMELYKANRFKNRVSIVDIPSYLVRYGTMDFSERSMAEGKMFEDLVNSDLVVFQEMGLALWSTLQKTKLYTLLYERYSRKLPFFVTTSSGATELETHIGSSNFFRVADECTFLEL